MNTKIRELKYKDRRTLSALIRKLSQKLGDNSLLTQLQSDPETTKKENKQDDKTIANIGMNLFNQLIQFLEDDISEWFCDLIGVNIETYMNEAPFDIELTIINQLMEDKGQFRSFLAGASKLYKSIVGSVNNLQIQKD